MSTELVESQLALVRSIKPGDQVQILVKSRTNGRDTSRVVEFVAASGWYGTPGHEMGGNHLFTSSPDEPVTADTTVRLFAKRTVHPRPGAKEWGGHPVIGPLHSVRVVEKASAS